MSEFPAVIRAHDDALLSVTAKIQICYRQRFADFLMHVSMYVSVTDVQLQTQRHAFKQINMHAITAVIITLSVLLYLFMFITHIYLRHALYMCCACSIARISTFA
jgi:hypothetical protein